MFTINPAKKYKYRWETIPIISLRKHELLLYYNAFTLMHEGVVVTTICPARITIFISPVRGVICPEPGAGLIFRTRFI